MDKIEMSKVDKRFLPKKIRSKSGWIGVQCHQNGFRAYIWVNGKKEFSRMFKTAEQAARARDQRAKQVYGERAILNF